MDQEEEIEARLLAAAELQLETEPFTGVSYRMKDNAVTHHVELSQAEERLQKVEQKIEENRRCREYYSNGGSSSYSSNTVSVPFLLIGTLNLKTGEVNAKKTHLRYVHNSVYYTGSAQVYAITSEPIGERQEISLINVTELPNLIGGGIEGKQLFEIQLQLSSEYSTALIEMKPIVAEENAAASPSSMPLSLPSESPSFPQIPTPSRSVTPLQLDVEPMLPHLPARWASASSPVSSSASNELASAAAENLPQLSGQTNSKRNEEEASVTHEESLQHKKSLRKRISKAFKRMFERSHKQVLPVV